MGASGLLGIVLPVFGIILLGYLLVRTRLLPQSAGDGLGAFVFLVPVPLLLFRALGTLELPAVSPWPFWAAYFSGALLILGLGILLTVLGFGRDGPAGVIGGMSASYGNVVMVGIPLSQQALGEPGLVLTLVLIAVHAPVMIAVPTLAIELAAPDREGGTRLVRTVAARVARALVTNPILIAIIAGALFRATGLPLTGVPRTIIDRVSDTAVPLALIALGMSLNRYGVRGNVVPALALGVLKLMVLPAIVYALAVHVFALEPLAVAVLTLSAATPSGINAYLMATRVETGLALSANTITLTTAASVATMTLWLAILGV